MTVHTRVQRGTKASLVRHEEWRCKNSMAIQCMYTTSPTETLTCTHPIDTPTHLPLLDNMIQGIYWFVGFQMLSCVAFLLPNCLLQFPDEHFKLSKLLQERLVGKEHNVLDIVVGLWSTAPLVQFPLLQGLMRVYAFQDAQPPKRRRGTSTGKWKRVNQLCTML